MTSASYIVAVTRQESIAVDWYAPERAAGGEDLATAVFVHGLGSNRRGEKALQFAQGFTARGWGFLALDLRGHGDSDGSMRALTLTRCLEDVRAALAWLPEQARPRLLIGSSMGGAVVAWHSVLHPRPGLRVALVAPSLGFPEALAERLAPAEREAWRREGVFRQRSEWIDLELGYGLIADAAGYPAERLRREYAVPTLIFHGMQDTAVDWEASLRWVRESPWPDWQLVLIKGGDHRLNTYKATLFDTLWAWLAAGGDGTIQGR